MNNRRTLAKKSDAAVHAYIGGVSYSKIKNKYIAISAAKNNEYGAWYIYYYKSSKAKSKFSSFLEV